MNQSSFESPVIYSTSLSGNLHQWRCWVDNNIIYTEHGRVGGTLTQTVGRSSANAIAEAQSMVKHRLERKYRLSPELASQRILLPMLAQPFSSRSKNLLYPAFIQPKYDGVRCMAVREDDDTISLLSRSGKPYHIDHIKKELLTVMPHNTIFDGELYQHEVALQDINSLVHDYRFESTWLKYVIFDVPTIEDEWELPQHARLQRLFDMPMFGVPHLIKAPTKLVKSAREARETASEFVAQGYEGGMVRSYDATYTWGSKRSPNLLKLKEFQDAEFQVIGFSSGEGQTQGCVIFTCITQHGKTFDVVPKAKLLERARMLTEAHRYIGKYYTVQFFDYSNDGVPLFPVGIAFRSDL